MLSPSRDRSIDRSTVGRPIVSRVIVTADDHREVLGLPVSEQAFWTECASWPCTASAWRRCRVH